MSLPRQRRGEIRALVLKSARSRPWRDRLPLFALVAGAALTLLALLENAHAAPPPRPTLPDHAQPMTAGELKILTAHPATYRNRDPADPVSYTIRPDGSLTVMLNRGKDALDGKWSLEADRFCIRIGWFYKSCSMAWRMGEASYFFWSDEDEDETSSLAHNTYDRLK